MGESATETETYDSLFGDRNYIVVGSLPRSGGEHPDR